MISQLEMYESVLTYLFSNGLALFVDGIGGLQEIMKNHFTHGVVQVLGSSLSSKRTLENAILGKLPIFLEDYSDIILQLDLEPWKIGPGLIFDYPVIHRLWEKNLKICRNPTQYRNIAVFNCRKSLKLSSNF